MKAPFFRHVFTGYIVIAVAFLLVGSTSGVVAFQKYARIVQVRELTRLTQSLALQISPIYTGKRSVAFSESVKKLAGQLNIRVTVIDAAGRVIGDSDKSPQDLENHLARPEIFAALHGGPGSATRMSQSVNRELVYVAVPLVRQGQIVAVVRSSVGVHDMRPYVQPFMLFILVCGLFFLSLVAGYALILARALAEPLEELDVAAQAMSQGQLKTRVHLRSPLFAGIGTTFNVMAEKLETTIVQTKQQKQDLAVLIEMLPAGIMVVDQENRVRLFNAAVQPVFGVMPVRDSYLWEFCRETVINELIALAKKGQGQTRDMACGARTYQVFSKAIPTGVLLLFQDVTEVRALAEIKRDFVVNASHELRTPLTAIKGFSENLVDELQGDHKHYAEIILKNTERLINIVQDIMFLSELEAGASEFKLEKFSIRKTLDDILFLFNEKAKQKNIALQILGEPELDIVADQFKLQQVFINLIDNALKYTDAGQVTVSIKREANKLRISVADTGIGIAREHLSRLFERFYVVDKSRSRKTGGTGLGLSIVKHIVLLHSGEIEVDSDLGKGTTITITLPL